jgi:hypothetical protein
MRRAGLTQPRLPQQTAGYTPVWPPTKLPGCVAWYDMQETYTESTGTVTAIRNMVTGSDLMAEATNPPALSLTDINGLPCMVPDGSNDRLVSTEAALVSVFSGSAKAWSIIVVVRTTSEAPAGTMAYFCAANSAAATNGSAGGFRIPATNVPPGCIRLTRTDDNGINGSHNSVAKVPVGVHVFGFICLGAVGFTAIDLQPTPPNLLRPMGVGPVSPDRVGLFHRPDSAADSFLNEPMGAAIVFNHGLSLHAYRSLAAGLMGRWRIRGA